MRASSVVCERRGRVALFLAGIAWLGCAARPPVPPPSLAWPSERYQVQGRLLRQRASTTGDLAEQEITIEGPDGARSSLSVVARRQSPGESSQTIANGATILREDSRQEISIKGTRELRASGERRHARLREPYLESSDRESLLEDHIELELRRDGQPAGTLVGGARSFAVSFPPIDTRVYVEDFGLRYLVVENGRVVAYASRSAMVEPRFDLQVRRELSADGRERALTAFLLISALVGP
jgi:hypothetical protein